MYSKKDDNENKGRKSGKGPKLSKGMKKAARQEKKTARKNKKIVKKIAKAVSKELKSPTGKLGGKANIKNIPAGMSKEGVTRFVGSQPTIGKIAKGSAYATGFESREKKTLKKKN